MRCWVKVLLGVLLVAAQAWVIGAQATKAHADTPRYPCDYPGVGVGGGGFGGSGAYCDFPVETNGSHWHCQTGRFSVFDIIGPGSVAAPGVGIGAEEYSCSFQCPDQTRAEPPNPPGAWKSNLKVNLDPKDNVCVGHDAPPQQYDQTQGQPPPNMDEGAPQPDVTTPLPPNPEQTHPQR
jgi:hypothetical protein